MNGPFWQLFVRITDVHVNRRNPLFIPVHKDFSKFSN